MQLGIIGLGKMGMPIGERLVRHKHVVYGYNKSDKHVSAEDSGLMWRGSLTELAASLEPPRTIWLMIPSGLPVDAAIADLLPHLTAGDIIIDGGNSYFKDTLRRSAELKEKGISLLDCGTSGGIWGLEEGYCLMIGGEKAAFSQVEQIFKDLAPEHGYAHLGPSGAGHFVKMVHNGVEYGMLQAYGEGFEILNTSQFDYDLKGIASLWNHSSVIRSWLLELAERAFAGSPDLEGIAGYVEDTGEGRWTVAQAIEQDVSAPVITLSLLERLRSRQPESFSAKVIAALRHQFGGHEVKKED